MPKINPKIIFVVAFLALFFFHGSARAALVICTGHNNECTICDFFAMVANTIGYTLKAVVPMALVLAVVVGGVIMMAKKDDPEIVAQVKNIFKAVAVGAFIAYSGWVVVTLALSSTGSFNKDSWWKFELNCQSCGDGFVKGTEVCDPAENVDECVARTASSTAECTKILASCSDECKIVITPLVCGAGDPLFDKIGSGCWLTENPADPGYCDRGKYACDEATGKISCKPTTPPVKDECCVDGGRSLDNPNFTFDKVRAEPYLKNTRKSSYTCDDVCAQRGEVCIGVGLINVAANKCIYINNHIGAKCDSTANKKKNNCRATYSTSSRVCYEQIACTPEYAPCGKGDGTVAFSVNETSCYCK